SDSRIEGNFLGTTPDGTAAYDDQTAGVLITDGATDISVGGAEPGNRNLISGHLYGVVLWDAGNHLVRGNIIGPAADGSSEIGNSQSGVFIGAGSSHNLVGGTSAGEANIIAYSGNEGVRIDGAEGMSPTSFNSIRRNSIHSNGGLGIAVVSGANGSIAAPTIAQADGTLASGSTCGGCTVEVFSDAGGQGAIYEGTAVADQAGHWSLSKPGGFAGPRLTATTTDPDGNTSEFSAPSDVP
ncbi:MAG TPA: hypothetical protein VM243_14680, partial [Phycisphaerae bacterium]|nr:hypothetical protein [Phycisphaerae bacterium]